METKRCTRCGETKDRSEFHRNTQRKDGLSPYCKVCQHERYRARREKQGLKPRQVQADDTGRVCTGCGTYLTWDHFGPNATGARGRSPKCRPCDNKRGNDKRRTQGVPKAVKLRKDETGRACTVCLVFKPWSQFATPKPGTKYRTHRCLECSRELHAQYMSDPGNKERAHARSAAWRKANPMSYILSEAKRRAAVRYVVTDRDLSRLLRRQRHLCAHCSVFLDERISRFVHLDHIVPLSRGGTHGIGNLQYLCQSCNVRKHDKLEMELRLHLMRRVRVRR